MAAKEVFRELAFTLCEGRKAPVLVTDIMAGHLVRQDLFKINILSRRLNAQANASIYRNIVVDLDSSRKAIKKASLLFRTLLTSKSAAQAVRTLSLAGDPLQDWRDEVSQLRHSQSVEGPLRGKTPPAMHADLSDFTQGEFELYGKLVASRSATIGPSSREVSAWELYLYALQFMPLVQDFSVSSDYLRFPDFRSALEQVARDPLVEKLQSCSLCLDLIRGDHRHACVVEDWDSVLLALFPASNLQSMAVVARLKPEAVRQLRPSGCSSMTRLTLHHYQIWESDLNSLLAAMPNLKYLNYHAKTEWAWLTSSRRDEARPEHLVGTDPLYNALHNVSDSLEELHISHDFDEDSIHFSPAYAVEWEPDFYKRGELSGLKRLHTLTIPYATLLGWRHRDCVWDWDAMLPSSLRRIVWTDDLEESCFADRWTDETLMPVISGLLEWLSAPERGNKAAEFGIHLARISDEFNKPKRQELALMCEEHGVRCIIEKLRADSPRPTPGPVAGPRGGGNMSRGRGGQGRGSGRGRGRGT